MPFGFLGPTILCWVIWLATGADAFPWPAIVMAATGIHLLRVLLTRERILAEEQRRLEKKAHRALRRAERERRQADDA